MKSKTKATKELKARYILAYRKIILANNADEIQAARVHSNSSIELWSLLGKLRHSFILLALTK